MSLNLQKKIVELLEAGVEFAVASVVSAKGSVPGKQGAKMIVLADGSQIGTVGGAGLEEKTKKLATKCITERKGGIFSFDLMYYKEGGLDSLCGGSVQIVVEHFARRPHLLICGGGHVGLAVAKACAPLEYGYSVLDDRADFASKERFPEAQLLFVAKPDEFFAKEDLSRFTHVLILGYSHQIDTAILQGMVKRFPGYIGLISSKTKKKEMFHRLKAHGITDADLERIEAPVGLQIGAETPAEIAVSILGSIIRTQKPLQPTEDEHAEKPGKPDRKFGPDVSRRGFLRGMGATAGAAAVGTPVFAQDSGPKVLGPGPGPVTLNVNGKDRTFDCEPRVTLLNALRNRLDLTGTKKICDRGSCGGCTVLLDGKPVNSCLMLAVDAVGRKVETIEGVSDGVTLSSLQKAFCDHDALQCGFCTPGMVMACKALLAAKPSPTLDDVKEGISGNICRCGTYNRIFDAVLAVAKK